MAEHIMKPRPALPPTAAARQRPGPRHGQLVGRTAQLNAGPTVQRLTSLGDDLAQRVPNRTGIPVNDDTALEREADMMGARALQRPAQLIPAARQARLAGSIGAGHGDAVPAQRYMRPFREVGPAAGVAQREGNGTAIGGVGLGLVGALVGAVINPVLGTIVAGAAIGGMIGILGGYIYDRTHRKPDALWRFYINPKDFDEAIKLRDPGQMYDRDKSKGYQLSMVKALQDELFGAELGGRVDYAEYERLHNSVTSNLQADNVHYTTSLESIRTRSSAEAGTGFPINDWNEEPTAPADDLTAESVGDLPMVVPYTDKMPLPNAHAREQGKPPSVTVFDPSGGDFNVRYSATEGMAIVQAILDRYYHEIAAADDVETLEEKEDIKLTAIVKVIRALHVTHPFKDANGRLHVQLLLNRFLLEQGFPPSIMPFDKGLGVFGGAFSLPALKKMVRDGFTERPPARKDKHV